MNGREIYEMLKKVNPNESIPENLCFLMEELGDIAKCIMYGIILSDNPEVDMRAYKGELKKSFGDMIVQLKLLIYRTGLTWKECEIIGEEAFKERMRRCMEKGWVRDGKHNKEATS